MVSTDLEQEDINSHPRYECLQSRPRRSRSHVIRPSCLDPCDTCFTAESKNVSADLADVIGLGEQFSLLTTNHQDIELLKTEHRASSIGSDSRSCTRQTVISCRITCNARRRCYRRQCVQGFAAILLRERTLHLDVSPSAVAISTATCSRYL